MTKQEIFRSFCNKTIVENPSLQDKVSEIYELAMDEIQQGGSESHEINLAIGDIENLISEKECE